MPGDPVSPSPLSAREHDAVLASGLHVLVFLPASGPGVAAQLAELGFFASLEPTVPVHLVDPRAEPGLARRHHVRELPHVVLYRDGLPVRRRSGPLPWALLVEAVQELADSDMDEEQLGWMAELLENDGVEFSPALTGADRR